MSFRYVEKLSISHHQRAASKCGIFGFPGLHKNYLTEINFINPTPRCAVDSLLVVHTPLHLLNLDDDFEIYFRLFNKNASGSMDKWGPVRETPVIHRVNSGCMFSFFCMLHTYDCNSAYKNRCQTTSQNSQVQLRVKLSPGAEY